MGRGEGGVTSSCKGRAESPESGTVLCCTYPIPRKTFASGLGDTKVHGLDGYKGYYLR